MSADMNRFFRLALIAAPFYAGFAAQEPPQAVVARMEQALSSLTTLQADFEQSYYSATVQTPLRQKGRMYFKKPDAMRWEYTTLEKNIYVFKDGLLLSYFPEDNQLWRQRIPKEKYETEILAFFAGQGGLSQKYIVEDNPFPGGAAGNAQLKLTPKEEGEYSYLLLEIDRASALIRRAVFFDWGGNKREFAFSKFKTGGKLDDGLFRIKVPADCEIIDDAGTVKR